MSRPAPVNESELRATIGRAYGGVGGPQIQVFRVVATLRDS